MSLFQERPYEPYFDYLSGKFPSGKIRKLCALKTSIHYILNDKISIVCNSNINYHSLELCKN